MKPKYIISEEKSKQQRLSLAVFGLHYVEDMAKSSGVIFFKVTYNHNNLSDP